MILRPHHILDILVSFGKGEDFTPSESGNGVHTAAALILSDLDAPILLRAGVDDICRPCRKLADGKRCTRVLSHVAPPIPMQDYNDDLDKRLLAFLDLQPDSEMTAGDFFRIVAGNLPGLEKVCTHPGEDEVEKLAAMRQGLKMIYMRCLK